MVEQGEQQLTLGMLVERTGVAGSKLVALVGLSTVKATRHLLTLEYSFVGSRWFLKRDGGRVVASAETPFSPLLTEVERYTSPLQAVVLTRSWEGALSAAVEELALLHKDRLSLPPDAPTVLRKHIPQPHSL